MSKSNTKITTKRNNSRIDLTAGPILTTLIRLAVPVTISMVMFTIYLLVDLYFVGRLGPDAVAALSISSNAFFIHLGFSTVLGTGAMALIAQAFGRKDYGHAAQVFKQSILMALIIGILETVTGLLIAPSYIKFFGGSGKSLQWGIQYFQIFSISFFFMILLYVIGNCFRGMGNTKTPMIILLQANILNIILDPILIFGWLGLPAMGVRGAAIASLISQIYALGIYVYFIFFKGTHIDVKGPWRLSRSIVGKDSLYRDSIRNEPLLTGAKLTHHLSCHQYLWNCRPGVDRHRLSHFTGHLHTGDRPGFGYGGDHRAKFWSKPVFSNYGYVVACLGNFHGVYDMLHRYLPMVS